MECFRESVSAPFSLRGKEKAAGGKKKTAKGELRRNKLHIPHPVRRLRRTGVVRSVAPPFPTRIASLDSRGSLAPFANPLKRPKKKRFLFLGTITPPNIGDGGSVRVGIEIIRL